MYVDRLKLYQDIERERNTKVIAYTTGDRPNMAIQIGSDAPDIFLEHLDKIGNVPKISLLVYTCGGDTLAGWNIINLIREFCKELEIIIPNKCRSTGTLMALGANKIIMTKQATLGPIDPSLISPLSPIINTNPPQNINVSVESVKGYLELLKNELHVDGDYAVSAVATILSQNVHPLVLGDVFRRQNQIQMLAKKLLTMSAIPEEVQTEITSFLCRDAGSHDYTISRTEALSLGLNIESPTVALYSIIKYWYDDVVVDLLLKKEYNPVRELGDLNEKKYIFNRGFIESISGGQDMFISEGTLKKNIIPQQNGIPMITINDERICDEWRHNYVCTEI